MYLLTVYLVKLYFVIPSRHCQGLSSVLHSPYIQTEILN